MHTITVIDEFQTINALTRGKSIGRFGDGELSLINEYSGINLVSNLVKGRNPEVFGNGGIKFARRLKQVLNSDYPEFLIGVPNIFNSGFDSKWRAKSWRVNNDRFRALLAGDKVYYSAFFSLPNKRDPSFSTHWQRIKNIWEQKHITIVNFNIALMEHPLFSNANKIDFITCPQRASWKEYDRIQQACSNTQCDIFLASMGPVATVLAHDLAIRGQQCIDIGQLASWYNKVHDLERESLY